MSGRRIETSERLFARAREIFPGGVNSPVRAFRSVGGTPLFIRRGEGAHLWDEDGNRYLDFCLSWGPLILGHAHPEIVAAVTEAAAEGMSFGAPSRREIELGGMILSHYPSAGRVRFVSSGTEAVMSAVRVARGFTGRNLVVKFEGCYHGHSDALLVQAGSGLATFGTASSAGVPAGTVADTVVLPLDHPDAFTRLMRERGRDVAVVLIEPVPANAGLLLQRREFLNLLRRETAAAGALLLFDEVISGFRVLMGGAAARYDLSPDLATFGKVIGGGMPVGAFAGRREILEKVAPLGAVYQAGTLSGNPVAMAAGAAALRVLARENAHDRLEALGAFFEGRVRERLEIGGHPVSFTRLGSIFWFAFQRGEAPRAWSAVDPKGAALYARFHHALLDEGIYFAPSAYEVGFLSTAHTEEMLAGAASAIGRALDFAHREIT
jgi:glutamate-1-semialdehyde 2,1-aminomutase